MILSTPLQIHHPGMDAFNVVTDIQHNTGKDVEDERETYRQKRRIDKKQPYFIDGNIKALAEIGTYPERISFKKCNDAL
jgi:hypothetical protein